MDDRHEREMKGEMQEKREMRQQKVNEVETE